ncbi:MAG: hypothetical protein IJR45_04455 [Firmicutes bacterium]|nr:hypothetical protein [Bacillota bacterium]
MKDLLKDNSLKAVTFFCAIECICVLLSTASDYIQINNIFRALPLLYNAALAIFLPSRIYSLFQIFRIFRANKGMNGSKAQKSILYIAAVNLCVILTYWLFTSVL